jgi:hypothetical protein
MNVNGVTGGFPPQQADNGVFQSRMQQAFAPVASLFGETSDQLMSELQSGKTSLSDLAKTKGISQDDLINAIKQGISQTAGNGAPNLSDTQLTNIANRIANHKHGGHHHHHRAESSTDASGSTQSSATGSIAL